MKVSLPSTLPTVPGMFTIAGRLDLETAIELGNDLAVLPAQPALLLDFRPMTFVEPFGMLYLSQAIRSWKKRYPGSLVTAIPGESDAKRYAAHVGFFESFGSPIGKQPGVAAGSTTYLPITYQKVIGLYKGGKPDHDAIQDIANRLAQQLVQDTVGDLVDAVAYSFREIVRNVVEHSEADEFGYCAQYWPAKNNVEISIIDSGVGLTTTLKRNPYLTVETDRDAIKYALMPGISSKVYKGIPNEPENRWQNSGFGLYINYRLCNQGGDFFIASGSAGLYRVHDADNMYHDLTCQGTALRLRLDTTQLRDIGGQLQEFARQGEKLAHDLSQGAVLTASKMSKLLRDDFSELTAPPAVGVRVRHAKFGEGTVLEVEVKPHETVLRVAFDGGRNSKVNLKALTELFPDSDAGSNPGISKSNLLGN